MIKEVYLMARIENYYKSQYIMAGLKKEQDPQESELYLTYKNQSTDYSFFTSQQDKPLLDEVEDYIRRRSDIEQNWFKYYLSTKTRFNKLTIAIRLATLLHSDQPKKEEFDQIEQDACNSFTWDKEEIGFKQYPTGKLGRLIHHVGMSMFPEYKKEYNKNSQQQRDIMIAGITTF